MIKNVIIAILSLIIILIVYFVVFVYGVFSVNTSLLPKPLATSSTVATNNSTANEDWSFMRSFAGKYYFHTNFFENTVVDTRLKSLLPQQEYQYLKKYLLSGPSGPIDITNGVLNFTICQEHNCGDTNSWIAVDMTNNKFYLIIKNNGVKKDYFEDTQNVPVVVSEWDSKN